MLLVYPHTTEVALANLGFQRVYGLLNRLDGVVCDRYALPGEWTADVPTLAPDQLRSRELGLQPQDFDMIAFSISFEPDYLNAALLLKYFGMPLEREERGPGHPLILAGGSAVFINPEPLAEVVDVFFIGEAEGLVAPFFSLYARNPWNDPRSLLPKAASLKGIYVPRQYRPRFDARGMTG
ncbi:MAG: radical SAM protein, partial [Nitrospinaceae bacterium]|nr:radical SAM protein [Nitrospinaceae bacterium]